MENVIATAAFFITTLDTNHKSLTHAEINLAVRLKNGDINQFKKQD